jgi:hypothetical protein
METCLLLGLYVAAFALQVVGVVLVVLDIRDDRQAAKTLAEASKSTKQLTEIQKGDVIVGGMMGAALAQASATADTFAEFVSERLTSRQDRKLLGVALVLLGALVGLAANLIATL